MGIHFLVVGFEEFIVVFVQLHPSFIYFSIEIFCCLCQLCALVPKPSNIVLCVTGSLLGLWLIHETEENVANVLHCERPGLVILSLAPINQFWIVFKRWLLIQWPFILCLIEIFVQIKVVLWFQIFLPLLVFLICFVLIVLVNCVYLFLYIIFTGCCFLNVIFSLCFFLLKILITLIKVPVHFIFEILRCLPFMYLLAELDGLRKTILHIELEAGDDRGHVIPFFRFVIECLVDKAVFHLLLFPAFYELLQALPLVHHFMK